MRREKVKGENWRKEYEDTRWCYEEGEMRDAFLNKVNPC